MNLYIFEVKLNYARNKSLIPIQAATWNKAMKTISDHPNILFSVLIRLVTPDDQHIKNPGNPADYDLNLN